MDLNECNYGVCNVHATADGRGNNATSPSGRGGGMQDPAISQLHYSCGSSDFNGGSCLNVEYCLVYLFDCK